MLVHEGASNTTFEQGVGFMHIGEGGGEGVEVGGSGWAVGVLSGRLVAEFRFEGIEPCFEM